VLFDLKFQSCLELLPELSSGESTDGMKFYKVFHSVKNTDTAELAYFNAGDFALKGKDGETGLKIIMIGDFECSAGQSDGDFTPGETYQGCNGYLLPEDAEPQAYWSVLRGEYFNNPVTWS